MFPLRPPFFGYPFNNFYLNAKKNTYSSYNMYNKNFTIDSNQSQGSVGHTCISNDIDNIRASKSMGSSSKSDEPRKEKDSSNEPFDDYFFEIFGLKLYFDDVLIICLLFFLYQEGVNDQELFISLILLLLS